MIFKGVSGRVSIKTKLLTMVTAVALSGAAAVVPFTSVVAQEVTIESLMAQIALLQAQIAALSGQQAAPVGGCTFTRSLTVGLKGDDVTCLQNYLTSTGHFTYSGGATGYFGSITKSAVAAWQAASGVSPAVGYFGPISQAKYSAVVVVAPAPTPTPTTTPVPTTSGTPAPVPAGSGLTVTADSMQPVEGALAPNLAARVPALNAVFTASADGDVTVSSILIQRTGQADDSAIDGVVLIDAEGMQIGLSKTLNALHQATLNESFVVKAGASKKMQIAFNRPTTTANAGQIAKFQIVSVNAGTATVNGTFPMTGPGITINESLTIGALASPTRGVLDPGAARTALEVGAKAFYASGARWTVGSAEAVTLEQIRFYQAGSAGSGDLANVMVNVKSVDYPATISSDGKYYTASIKPGIVFDKGAVIDVAIKIDVAGGSNRTIDFDIQRRTDVVAKGNTFNYYIIPANGTTANTTTQGEGFRSNEPYYDAYEHTVTTGTLRLEKSNTLPAGNVGVDISNTPIGAFGIEAKGEEVNISSFKLTMSLSGGSAGTLVTGISLVNAAGVTIAGPKDAGSDKTVTFSDTFTIPVGYNVYTVKAKLSTDFADAVTIAASSTPGTDITAKGVTTGLSITATPATGVAANTMTIRKGSLATSMADSPVAQNVVRGINGFGFSKIQYDASASGEDLRVTSQDMTVVTSGSADSDALNTCQLFDGATALNTGGNVVGPTGATGADVKVTFTLDNNLFIPKGTVKLVDVKCNIGQDATAAETWSLGFTSTGEDTTVVGKETGTTVTEVITRSNGPTMTVRANGTVSAALDASSPSERYGLAGKTGVAGSIFKLTSQYEALKLTKFGFALASSTASTSDVIKVSFWDGATSVGEAVFSSGNHYATTTLSADFIVPKDGDKLLSSTVDLIAKDSLGKATAGGGDSGHLVSIDWAGYLGAAEAIGQSSGSTLTSTSITGPTAAKGIRVVKTYPTLERVTVPTNTLTNGDMDLYRFKVTAPSDGDVGLFKFTFRVATGTQATTSSFRLFAYTDSGFASQAYATNPVNQNDVDCIGSNSLEVSATEACNAGGAGTAGWDYLASSSHVVIYADPQNGTATVPGREAIQVPAGTSRYFKLVGNIASAATGDSFTVALVGDAAFFPPLNDTDVSGIARDTLSQTDRVGGGNANISGVLNSNSGSRFFVWSPNTTTTSATSTNDWLGGYLVPGLPSTEMAQQAFSK